MFPMEMWKKFKTHSTTPRQISSLVQKFALCAASPKAFSIIDIMTAQTKRLSFSLARRMITPASS
jgi:hypothetical protein